MKIKKLKNLWLKDSVALTTNAEYSSVRSLVKDLKAVYPNAKFLYFTDFYKPSFESSIMQGLKAAIPDIEIVNYNGVDDTINLITKVDLVVSVKLHDNMRCGFTEKGDQFVCTPKD